MSPHQEVQLNLSLRNKGRGASPLVIEAIIVAWRAVKPRKNPGQGTALATDCWGRALPIVLSNSEFFQVPFPRGRHEAG